MLYDCQCKLIGSKNNVILSLFTQAWFLLFLLFLLETLRHFYIIKLFFTYTHTGRSYRAMMVNAVEGMLTTLFPAAAVTLHCTERRASPSRGRHTSFCGHRGPT